MYANASGSAGSSAVERASYRLSGCTALPSVECSDRGSRWCTLSPVRRGPASTRRIRAGLLFGLTLIVLLLCGHARAQSSQTWVSGVGDDLNDCSRNAPCLTFSRALTQTDAGGEINVLDPGGFDFQYDATTSPETFTYTPLVINKPVTINGGAGRVAGMGPLSPGDAGAYNIVITSQLDAIVVNVPLGSNGPVVLRNLSLNGFRGTGRNGLRIISAASVSLQNVEVTQFSDNCLLVDAGLSGSVVDVANSTFTNCGIGIKNNGNALVSVGDSTVALNTTAGVSSSGSLGSVILFSTFAMDNPRNTIQVTYTSQTPAIAGTSAYTGVAAGSASATIGGGSVAGCAFATQGFVSPTSVGSGLPGGASPVAAAFQFTTTDCGAGSSITISLSFSQALPLNARLYKYGPATVGALNSTWFALSGATLSSDGKTFTYSITDNGIGDSNNAPGFISDPVAPFLIPPDAVAIPALSVPAMLLMMLLIVGIAARSRRLSDLGRR